MVNRHSVTLYNNKAVELATKIGRAESMNSKYVIPLLYSSVMWKILHYNLSDEDEEDICVALQICKVARNLVDGKDECEAIYTACEEWNSLEGKSFNTVMNTTKRLIDLLVEDKCMNYYLNLVVDTIMKKKERVVIARNY